MDITRTLCSLKTSKNLKLLGYNEFSEFMYCTDFRHNGKHINYEEELDLRAEGKANEIETIPFGDMINLPSKNEWCDDNSCMAPKMHDAVDWLREKFSIVVYNEPFYIVKTQQTLYRAKIMCLSSERFCKYVDLNYLSCLEEFGSTDYWEALDKALLKTTEILIAKKDNGALEEINK